jgi:uncharacterized protein with von Willebrand factor type A (vWA) domain
LRAGVVALAIGQFVDAMRPGHNLESLAGLCAALAKLR